MVSPSPSSGVTRQRIRRVFIELDEPHTPLTVSEVAQSADCPEAETRSALEDLQADGELGTKHLSDNLQVWWLAGAYDSAGHSQGRTEFQAFVNTVHDHAIFMLSPAGIVTSWNEGARRIKGYQKEEIVGKHFSTFYTEEDVEAGRPEKNIETALSEGHVEDEGWRVRADGTKFWANVTITPIRDSDGSLRGFTKVTRDMTEQREYEEKLRTERNLTEQVLEAVPVSVFVTTGEGVITRANRRAFEELGLEPGDIGEFDIGSWDVYDDEGEVLPSAECPMQEVLDTDDPINHFECQIDLPEVGRRSLSVNLAPLSDAQSSEERVVFAVEDITERKQREQELRREYNQTEKLLRTAPIAIAVRDSEGDLVVANDRAQEALGITEEESLEATVNRPMHDPDGDRLSPTEIPSGRVLSTGESVSNQEVVIDYSEDDRRHFRVNAAPVFDEGGDLHRVIATGEEITELKQREQELEQRKAELETELSEIYGRISDAFVALDGEWRFTYLNERAHDVINPEGRELEGKRVWEEFPKATEREFKKQYERAMYRQETVSFEEYYPEPLDAWFEIRAYPSESGLSVYFRDITERKEREEQLRESERRYRALAENFPNGIVALFNEDLEYMAAGGELLDTLEIDISEALGQSVYDLYEDDVLDRILPHFEAALDGEESSFEMEYHNRHLLAHALPVDPSGKGKTGMLVVQDITEQREYRRKLEASNERLEQFAYAASHDLQEPLRMVSSYLRLIENRYGDQLDEDGEEFLEFAVDGADRMRDMIDGLLEYSRVDTRGEAFESVDLNAVLEDVREDLRMLIEESDAEIETEALPEVYGDADQLRQVFQNLLDNAIEYSGDGPPRVHVSAERDRDRWVVSVEDDGIGVDPADADQIFEVFQSIDSTGESPGTGIGLALCRRIIERHGGEIWVEGTPGDGSTFRFTLPTEQT